MLSIFLDQPKRGIDRLAAVILYSSVNCAKMFKDLPSDQYLQILFEFVHFYIHLMNRVCLLRMSEDRRISLHSKVLPCVFTEVMRKFVSAAASERTLEAFITSNCEREFVYSGCAAYLPYENPLDKRSVFSKLASIIADACGVSEEETFAKAIIAESHRNLKEMDLVNLVMIVESEV